MRLGSPLMCRQMPHHMCHWRPTSISLASDQVVHIHHCCKSWTGLRCIVRSTLLSCRCSQRRRTLLCTSNWRNHPLHNCRHRCDHYPNQIWTVIPCLGARIALHAQLLCFPCHVVHRVTRHCRRVPSLAKICRFCRDFLTRSSPQSNRKWSRLTCECRQFSPHAPHRRYKLCCCAQLQSNQHTWFHGSGNRWLTGVVVRVSLIFLARLIHIRRHSNDNTLNLN